MESFVGPLAFKDTSASSFVIRFLRFPFLLISGEGFLAIHDRRISLLFSFISFFLLLSTVG